jgi:hypothetical protein
MFFITSRGVVAKQALLAKPANQCYTKQTEKHQPIERQGSMFKLTKSIPVPPRKKLPYPFAEMEIGDSFSVPNTERKRLIGCAAGYKFRSKTPWNYTTRTENGEVRLWRTL